MNKVWALLPYQARWVRDRSGVKVCEKSRRIGLSFCEAYDAVMHAAEGLGNVYYQCPARDMTRQFIDDARAWAEALHGVALEVGEEVIREGGREKHLYSLTFASGKRIEAITAAARQLRAKGKPGDRAVIDEAAFCDDLGELLKAAMAFRIWGGSVHVLSTHNGVDNPFNVLTEDVRHGRKPYSLHTIPFARAVEDGLCRRIFEVSKRAWSERAERDWVAATRREYEDNMAEELDCVPASGAGAWIGDELLLRATHADAGDPEKVGNGFIYIGNDIARRRDQWVATVVENASGVAWLREERILEDQPFAEHDRVIEELMRRYRVSRLVMDQTGMGERSSEEARRRYGSRVEGVILAGDQPLNIATAARERFEEGTIRIPDDATLRAEIRKIKRTSGATGKPRLVSDRDKGGHADRAWALFLALAGMDRAEVDFGAFDSAGRTVSAGVGGYAGADGLSGYLQ